jgi:ADP-ribosylglycohydrolase
LLSRARGALLGHAAGSALGQITDAPALTLALAEELLEPEIDLRRLARRWLESMEHEEPGAGGWTRTALEHIATHQSPPSGMDGQADCSPLARCLPVALAAHGSPANLVSGTYHTTLLTHPDERCAWGAVALNVAAATFLNGRRDFIPDVIEVLQSNDAPEELLAAARRIPLESRQELPIAEPWYAPHAMEIGLWFGYHEPKLSRGVEWLVSSGAARAGTAAIVGGLLGVRDGEEAVPVDWLAELAGLDRIRRAAERLVGAGGKPRIRSSHQESQC